RRCGNRVCEPNRGETCSSCPQDCGTCLDAAVPDAAVDDAGTGGSGGSGAPMTMGGTSVLSIHDSGNGNLPVAPQASLGQPATLQALSFYVTTGSGQLRLGVYDASGPGGDPAQKLAETAEMTPVVGWNTAAVITPAALTAGTYWLAYLPSDNNLHFP